MSDEEEERGTSTPRTASDVVTMEIYKMGSDTFYFHEPKTTSTSTMTSEEAMTTYLFAPRVPADAVPHIRRYWREHARTMAHMLSVYQNISSRLGFERAAVAKSNLHNAFKLLQDNTGDRQPSDYVVRLVNMLVYEMDWFLHEQRKHMNQTIKRCNSMLTELQRNAGSVELTGVITEAKCLLHVAVANDGLIELALEARKRVNIACFATTATNDIEHVWRRSTATMHCDTKSTTH
jgi:hypothetical protein